MVYEIPFLGGVWDGRVESFSELRPWWDVPVYPRLEVSLFAKGGEPAALAARSIQVETYRLTWYCVPMLDVNWHYAVYVSTGLKEPLPWFSPNGTHVVRQLRSRRARVLAWLDGLQRELEWRESLEADTELECWGDETELES